MFRWPCDSAVEGVLGGMHTGPEVAVTHRLPGGAVEISRPGEDGTPAASFPAGGSLRLGRSVRTVMPLIPVDVR
ncbi:hypothetical protein GCM10009536_03820 [Streptomyces thermocarboxydus]